jgi:hypothetical protein
MVLEASGAEEEASPEAGAAAESVADEVAAWSADFWQPVKARAKQKAKTLAAERRRIINYLHERWAIDL